MPQGPIAVAGANLIPQGAKVQYNISAAVTLKAAPGTLLAIAVITPGDAPGTVNDCATTGAAATANAMCGIPETVNVYPINLPFKTGLTITPGAGQVIAVYWI